MQFEGEKIEEEAKPLTKEEEKAEEEVEEVEKVQEVEKMKKKPEIEGIEEELEEKPEKIDSKEIEKEIKLPPQFKIGEERKDLVERLWECFPPEIREFLSENIESLKTDDAGEEIGNGHVLEGSKDRMGKKVAIGACFDTSYFAELFLHEVGHIIGEDYFEKKLPLSIRSTYIKGLEKMKDKVFGESHLSIDALPLFVLYPQKFQELSQKIPGWKELHQVYQEVIGDIPQEKRKEIRELINRKTKEEKEKWEEEKLMIGVKKAWEDQRKGYLVQYFPEIFDNK